MQIEICEDCGRKYAEAGTICDSCQDLRNTMSKLDDDDCDCEESSNEE